MLAIVLASALWAAIPPQKSAPPAEAEPQAVKEAGPDAALAEYDARRKRLRDTADGHWKMVLWCDRHGMEAEALSHCAEVLRHDPHREAAWMRLGYRRHEGHWMNAAQIAEAEVQKKADRKWQPLMARWHNQLHFPHDRPLAEAALAGVDEPRAVPAIWNVFGTGAAKDQLRAVQLLGQIASPQASRTLAMLAVFSASAEVRTRAIETLRTRDPADVAGPLVALLHDPLTYEVRPVAGPGKAGALFVGGEKYNVKLLYAPPPPPRFHLHPNDFVRYDEYGLPIVVRPLGGRSSKEFFVGRNLIESQKAALGAQQQLADDIAAVERMNAAIRESNDRALAALAPLADPDLGKDLAAWRSWAAKAQGITDPDPKDAKKPTFNQFVPVAYAPSYASPLAHVTHHG